MSPQNTSQNEIEKVNTTSLLYDDALPESLKFQGILGDEDAKVRIHNDTSGVSPYIIHLSRPNTKPIPTDTTTTLPNLEALAQSLIIDDVDDAFIDEAGEIEAETLEVNFEELIHQLRDDHIPEAVDTSLPVTMKAAQIPKPEQPLETPSVILSREEIRKELMNFSPTVTIEAPPRPEPVAIEELPPIFADKSLPVIEEDGEEKRIVWSVTQFFSPRIRAVSAFVFLSFAFIFPLQAIQGISSVQTTQSSLTSLGEQALGHFLRGTKALESQRFDVAGVDFARASQEFAAAESSLKELNGIVAAAVNVIPQTDRTYETVRGLVEAGKELSEAASILAEAGKQIGSKTSLSATQKLTLLSSYLKAAYPHVRNANAGVSKIDPALVPAGYSESITKLTQSTPALMNSMEEFLTFADALNTIMGGKRKMRYLVAFQNNTELRATGGFIGSFAEMDIFEGRIENIHIPAGGTYDLQGQLSAFVEPPKALSLLNPRWEFHDSNWFPDFPSSARKLLWFYDEAGGPTIDGVIAINATMMPKLLEILGPVEMPEYGRTITAENFLFETQKIVEFEYEQYQNPNSTRPEEAPKQFIGDLAPILLERLEDANMDTMLAVAEVLGSGLEQKDIMLYFNDNELQSNMQTLGWAGEMKQTNGDYLMVVNTNLGGGKTDTVIDQTIDVDVHVEDDGRILNTVTITKSHLGLATSLFESANNVDYIRLYVPEGSKLISAEGFEIPPAELFERSELPLEQDPDLLLEVTNQAIHETSGTDTWNEHGKTVFGNWIQTAPGETETVTFTYELPFILNTGTNDNLVAQAKERIGLRSLETYTLLIQKQPGVETRNTLVNVQLPSTFTPIIASHPEMMNREDIRVSNERDHFLHLLLEKKD